MTGMRSAPAGIDAGGLYDLGPQPLPDWHRRPRPLWSILIPTLASRQAKFLDLTADLTGQIREWDTWRSVHGQLASASVEIVALHNNGEHEIGAYRQRLLDSAAGEWVSFVDDDDLVASTFVTELAACLTLHGPQIVGFPMWLTDPYGRINSEADLSLRYDGWDQLPDGRITCDLTHIQPIRADLARLGRFDSGGFPEDRAWRAQVRPHLDLAGEHYIHEHLYFYRRDPSDSVQTDVIRLAEPAPRPDLGAVRWAEL